ncbi:hypothetical protein QBA35_40900 [Streptomyces bottropensis]|uniref:Uncharacterized protein n=1 Tax=Streptomyces bottropensis TaxID=42235 RepID=A0ABU8B0P7_9ACTN
MLDQAEVGLTGVEVLPGDGGLDGVTRAHPLLGRGRGGRPVRLVSLPVSQVCRVYGWLVTPFGRAYWTTYNS